MPLSEEELLEIRLDALAEDLPIDLQRMRLWSHEQAVAYFELGPPPPCIPAVLCVRACNVIAPVRADVSAVFECIGVQARGEGHVVWAVLCPQRELHRIRHLGKSVWHL